MASLSSLGQGMPITLHYQASNVPASTTTEIFLSDRSNSPIVPAGYRFCPLMFYAASNGAISTGNLVFRIGSDSAYLNGMPAITLTASKQADTVMLDFGSVSIRPEVAVQVAVTASATYAPVTIDLDVVVVGRLVPGAYSANSDTLNGVDIVADVPDYVSSEIGTVGPTTVAVTFDQGVRATNYATGVTIKVNGGSAESISSATRQTDFSKVRYVIGTTVKWGDVVTWEYSAAAGNIVSEAKNEALLSVTAQTVTNTVAAIPPIYNASEIGTVGATTVAVTFTQNVTAAASDYKTGVIIKVAGAPVTISSGTRQINHAVVYYVVTPAVVWGQAVTWEYSTATGIVKAEYDGSPLATTTAKTVTNNIAAVPPVFSAAEVGVVDASTVAVTFTHNVNAAASDYLTSVIVKVGGAPVTVSTGTRQGTKTIVYYALAVPIVWGNVVTWEYSATTGHIVAELDGSPLATTTAQAVTNTVAAVPPAFSAAEIGTVDASTVAVTFTHNVTAASSDYLAGVVVKVNAAGATISTGIRQTNHAIVYYALSAPVVNGDTVTWEYDKDVPGKIVAELDGSPLPDVSAQSVTNNVAP